MVEALRVSSFQNDLEIKVTPLIAKYMLKQIAETGPHCQYDYLYHQSEYPTTPFSIDDHGKRFAVELCLAVARDKVATDQKYCQ